MSREMKLFFFVTFPTTSFLFADCIKKSSPNTTDTSSYNKAFTVDRYLMIFICCHSSTTHQK